MPLLYRSFPLLSSLLVRASFSSLKFLFIKVQKRLKGTKIKVWNSYHPETITVNKNSMNYQVKKKNRNFIQAQLRLIAREADFQKALRTGPPVRSLRHSHTHFKTKDHTSK